MGIFQHVKMAALICCICLFVVIIALQHRYIAKGQMFSLLGMSSALLFVCCASLFACLLCSRVGCVVYACSVFYVSRQNCVVLHDCNKNATLNKNSQ